jgi:hypothetical protein
MAITRTSLNNDYFDDYNYRSKLQEEEMKKLHWMQQQAMAQAGFIQSGQGAASKPAPKPDKPKHLNPKLLLTKGA